MTNLEKVYADLKELEQNKRDFVVTASELRFVNGELIVVSKDKNHINPFKASPVFEEQVCERLAIPKGYYDRMKKSSLYLLDENVNHWFAKSDKRHLIRTYDNSNETSIARAILSDRHHMIDNYPVLLESLKAIDELGLRDKIEVVSASLTEKKMYIEFTCPSVEIKATELLSNYRHAIERGFGIISGFLLSNSEVGKGAFTLSPRAVVLACKNGLLYKRHQLRKVHLGSKLESDGFDVFDSKEVRDANVKLIREQMKYGIETYLSEKFLNNLISHYEESALKPINAPVNKLAVVIADNFGWTEKAGDDLLMRFVGGGDLRRIGMVNAMTEVAQGFDSDNKYLAEEASYEVLNSFEKFERLAFAEVQKN